MDTLGRCAIPLRKILLVLSSLMLAAILATSLSGCFWEGSNVPISPQIAATGTGGAIFAWLDGINCGNLYAQSVDADGNLAWGNEGKLICDRSGNPRFPLIASDGLGGAFISWDSLKDRQSMLAHVDARGEILWQKSVSKANIYVYSMASDGSGGVVMVLQADFGPPTSIQRADSDGRLLWGEGGMSIPQATISALDLFGYGLGWTVVLWQDDRGANTSINGQTINSEGQLLWTGKTLVIANSNNDRSDPQLLASEDGSVIIVWLKGSVKDQYNHYDVYAQKITRQGERLWGNEGVPICTSTGNQYDQRLATDGEGGCIVVWDDCRNFSGRSSSEVYAQHIASDGTCLWNANGTLVWGGEYSSSDTFSYSPRDEQVISDNMGGAIFMWIVFSEGNFLAQRVDPNGNPLWSPEGLRVFDLPTKATVPTPQKGGVDCHEDEVI